MAAIIAAITNATVKTKSMRFTIFSPPSSSSRFPKTKPATLGLPIDLEGSRLHYWLRLPQVPILTGQNS